MQTTRLTKISFAAVAGLLVAASSVQAQVLLNNDFTFASRTSNPNGGTPSSGATAVTGLDANIGPTGGVTGQWDGVNNSWVVATANGAMAGNAGGPAFFDAINVAGPVNGNALRVMNLGAAFSLSSYFSSQTLGNGDKLSVSFTIRTSGASPTSSANNFGLGLFHSAGTQLTANSTTGNLGNPAFNDDVGYQFRYTASGASALVGIVQERGTTLDSTRNIFNGPYTGLTGLGAPVAGGGIAADVNYGVTLELTRSLDGLKNTLTSTFNGATQTFEDTTTPLASFDHLAIFFGSQWGTASPNQRANYVDDVLVTYTAVPEPATATLAGLGLAALIAYRRRTNA